MAHKQNPKQAAYIKAWERENYFKCLLRLPKDLEADIRSKADADGKSLNGYIKDLITADLNK